MRCLQDEAGSAQTEARVIFDRWIRDFGDEAVIHYDQNGDRQ
ncbi:hypothetical protein [Acuticoccus sediminis]|nr:hypothetical protein [Acuticoccus sediminis]